VSMRIVGVGVVLSAVMALVVPGAGRRRAGG